MQIRALKQLVEHAGDAAFAIDSIGSIVAWNAAAERLFGLKAEDAIGRFCCDLIRGSDETGRICGPECSVQRAVRQHQPVSNFDIEVPTPEGDRWCNVSVLIVDVARASRPYSLHIWRSIDVSKRFDQLLLDVAARATGLPRDTVRKGISEVRPPARAATLTRRELEVLRLLAQGASTKEIGAALKIRTTTVNNHVGHILDKLDAHSRFEAVRRAEQAGLV